MVEEGVQPRMTPGIARSAGMMHRCVAVMILLLAPTVAPSQDVPDRIDAIFTPLVADGSPGYAVGVVRDGRLLVSRTYGLANLETGVPITTATCFRLASLTKQFTAMAVMLLVHDGKLRYEDTLIKVFPEFPDYGRGITIRHLLNHTSGLKDYEDIYDEQMRGRPPDKVPQITDAGVFKIMKQQSTTLFPPGSRWRYSNSGYAVLAMAVECISGKPFEDFLRDRIFKPLHMDRTVAFVPGRNQISSRAYGYRKGQDGWVLSDQSATSAVLGDGGVYTSINDFVKWVNALDRHMLLDPAEMQPAFTPVDAPGVEAPDHTPGTYGFGWFLDPYRGHRRTWHYGETCGFLTAIQRFPDDRLTIAILSNRIDTDPTPLALKIADMFLFRK